MAKQEIKIKIVLGLITIALLGFVFRSQLITLIFPSPDVEGCMDPLAVNYDPNATIDIGSCTQANSLSPGLLDSIQLLERSDWDHDFYMAVKDDKSFNFPSHILL